MNFYKQILNLFDSNNEESFNSVAVEVFRYQASHNPLYKQYLDLIDCNVQAIKHYNNIPLLPITLFKMNSVKTSIWESQRVFLSSGTTQSGLRSMHHVRDIDWYNSVSAKAFSDAGFTFRNTNILALLPSYMENGDSSLVHMVSHFQALSKTEEPSSFLYNHEDLIDRIRSILDHGHNEIVLFGVTYALLDFAKKYHIDTDRLRIIFTGGMKNKGIELSYLDIVARMRSAFGKSAVYSEYGMTEMLSQAYATDTGKFNSSPTLRILTKQLQDPFENTKLGKTGTVGLIDLANVDTLSFIQTQDLGIKHSAIEFELIGRIDSSDLRGCNLLYESDYF